jgi:putative FmdB family regulatory protein
VPQFDLVCRECGRSFTVTTAVAIKEKQKRCPACRSDDVRQSFVSYLRNGPLWSPDCGAPRSSGFG